MLGLRGERKLAGVAVYSKNAENAKKVVRHSRTVLKKKGGKKAKRVRALTGPYVSPVNRTSAWSSQVTIYRGTLINYLGYLTI